jgi:hypothetical protein
MPYILPSSSSNFGRSGTLVCCLATPIAYEGVNLSIAAGSERWTSPKQPCLGSTVKSVGLPHIPYPYRANFLTMCRSISDFPVSRFEEVGWVNLQSRDSTVTSCVAVACSSTAGIDRTEGPLELAIRL